MPQPWLTGVQKSRRIQIMTGISSCHSQHSQSGGARSQALITIDSCAIVTMKTKCQWDQLREQISGVQIETPCVPSSLLTPTLSLTKYACYYQQDQRRGAPWSCVN